MADATASQEGQRFDPELPSGVRPDSRSSQSSPGRLPVPRLLRTIEEEVIPRVVLSLRSLPASTVSRTLAVRDVTGGEIADFAALITTQDVSMAREYIESLLSRGLSLETVYLELLAPAARLLGEWWDQDVRDFTEVTGALCCMHRLLHEFSSTFVSSTFVSLPQKRILLIPVPGEQHSFGLIMVAEFFRRANWDVWDPNPSCAEELMGTLRGQWFAVVGVSVGCASNIHQLGPLIAEIRQASRNASLGVMVGGPPFIGHPELVKRVGADCSAIDAHQATLEADKLMWRIRTAEPSSKSI